MSDFEWCTDCKEYDHERHCCPRWTKVIRNTLNDSINAVLDKIRAEIEQVADEESKFDKKWAQGLKYALKIIDKYKSESEGENADSD